MNKRARHARRILRDHRRGPRRVHHFSAFPEHRYWRCPRCLPERDRRAELLQLLYGPPEEHRPFDPFDGLKKLFREWLCIREGDAWAPMAEQLLRNVERTAVERDPTDGDIIPND